jgi:serine/threonine protein kinase
VSASPPFVQFGRFRLFKSLKKGGMARVHLALDPDEAAAGVDRLYAVKTLLPEFVNERAYREMFATEGKVGRRLEHPHIVRTWEAGVQDGNPYIAMELIFGQDVSTILRRLRRTNEVMPLPLAVGLARDVCAGLAHAHGVHDEHGQPLEIVNRDVSPGNVMVSWSGEVKLIDFGIAQTTFDVRTQIGTIKGKLSYMSPEQVRGLPVDARSDVFAVGTMLYELATGVQVFHDEGDFATMERVRRAEFEPPSAHNPQVDPELDAIITRALSREVGARPSSRELHRMLGGWLTARGLTVGAAEVSGFVHALFGAEYATVNAEVERARREALGLVSDLEPSPRQVDDTPARKTPAPPETLGTPRAPATQAPAGRVATPWRGIVLLALAALALGAAVGGLVWWLR